MKTNQDRVKDNQNHQMPQEILMWIIESLVLWKQNCWINNKVMCIMIKSIRRNSQPYCRKWLCILLTIHATPKSWTWKRKKAPHICCLQSFSGILLQLKVNKCKVSSDPNIWDFSIRFKVPLQVSHSGIDWIKVYDKQSLCRPHVRRRPSWTGRSTTTLLLSLSLK